MKTWICNTLSTFFWPMAGTARLYPYVKEAGFDITFKDFNQDSYFNLFSKPYLENYIDKLKYKLDNYIRNTSFRENIGSIIINSSGHEMVKLIQEYCKKSIDINNIIFCLFQEQDHILLKIEESRQILDKYFLNLNINEFLKHLKILLCAKAIVDALYYPTQIDLGFGFYSTEYSLHVDDINKAVNDEKHNYLIQYYKKEIIPEIEKEHPDVIGLSITHSTEFFTAFTLANLIKQNNPNIHICLGGSTITEIAYKIQKNNLLWQYFDSIILGPGEFSFCTLLDCLETNTDLSQVPNLIYKEKNKIKKSEKNYNFNINDAKTPEYVNLRPNTVLSLETSNRCYWGKCIFCYYPKIGLNSDCGDKSNFRDRNLESVIQDIKTIKEKYNPTYIGITDSALHPKRLNQIIDSIKERQINIKFSAFIRFEKEFLSKSFCDKIVKGGFVGGQVGLESGSQRVNNIINKGVNIKDAEVIINNFFDAGILIHVYAIAGIPGETIDDTEMTYKFINKLHKYLTLDWQIYSFYLLEKGPIAERTSEFNMKANPLPDNILTQLMDYEIKNGISQEKSLELSIYYESKLKKYRNELHKILDIETYKLILISTKIKNKNLL